MKKQIHKRLPKDFVEDVTEDIEVILRRKEGKDYLFFLSHSDKYHQVKLDRIYQELLERRKYFKDSLMTIEPKGVRILCRT